MRVGVVVVEGNGDGGWDRVAGLVVLVVLGVVVVLVIG